MSSRSTRIAFMIAAAASLAAVAALVSDGVATLRGGLDRADVVSLGAPESARVSGETSAGSLEGSDRWRSGASAILARNIFDSSAGPVAPAFGEGGARWRGGGVGPCGEDGIRVFATVTDADPTRSLALIADGDGAPRLAAEGERFADRVVERIGWRYVLIEGGDETSCYVDLYGIDDVVYQPVDRSGRESMRGGAEGI